MISARSGIACVCPVGLVEVIVMNYYANGSRTAYSVTPTFVDDVAPRVIGRSPAAGAVNVGRHLTATVRFDEPVTGVSSTSVQLRDTVTGGVVPATVTYDGSRNEAAPSVASKLAAERVYRVEVTSAIMRHHRPRAGRHVVDVHHRHLRVQRRIGSPFEYDIAWLAETGITAGCGATTFCPRSPVTREQMASFLVRALPMPVTAGTISPMTRTARTRPTSTGSPPPAITGGCGAATFCPRSPVTREQMASFLARALHLPATATDYFTDDESSAARGRYQPAGRFWHHRRLRGHDASARGSTVTREQMAAFLHRALGD